MQIDLSAKTVVITGSASGIGAETVRLFLEAGANVIAVDVNAPAAATAIQDKYGKQFRCIVGDVSKQETSQRYVREVLDVFGRIDVLINNAAIAIIKPIADHSEEEWDRVMNINVKSLFWSAKAVVPVMKEQKSGLILNTGSISSVVGLGSQGAYGPSKGAVIQVTRQMAIDYAPFGIRVNAVCPGTVDTPLVRKAGIDSGDPVKFLEGLKSAHPIGRIAQPEEIAAFFLFLASDHARFFTGAVLMIDGGFTAQ
jgi:NAD(P)-dependent dehydrogenase (short-subunit alcohol dehydrogenase family)